LDEVSSASPQDANQQTIRALIALNNNSIQNSELNEHTISKMIERNQLSVLTGGQSRPPTNFSNQDPVARTIEANQLTVHSMHGVEAPAGEVGIITRSSEGRSLEAYVSYLRAGYGRIAGITIVIAFFLAHALRFISGKKCNTLFLVFILIWTLFQMFGLYLPWMVVHSGRMALSLVYMAV
jgi:hypothetical protein